MKIGDLVRVVETRTMGGIPTGGLGLVTGEDLSQTNHPRWVVRWISGNDVGWGLRMSESTTYGHGLEVISSAGEMNEKG